MSPPPAPPQAAGDGESRSEAPGAAQEARIARGINGENWLAWPSRARAGEERTAAARERMSVLVVRPQVPFP